MLSPYSINTNILLLTLDSCRWDTFQLANAPHLKTLCNFRCAYSQATYTYPSHMSIFSGILPDVREPIPYYNRFKTNLFRIRGRRASVDSYIEFPPGTPNIISGFEALGYRTFGCGAMEWFKHPNLASPFQEFVYTGIHLAHQVDFLHEKISSCDTPFFAFANIGETHEPYEHGGLIQPSLESRARMRRCDDNGFLSAELDKQIESLEYIDKCLGPLLQQVSDHSNRTVAIVCADHGECFGEDGLYGHGFYHPKVMEVPLGIFEI